MQKILRNVPPAQKITPNSLQNTRPPSDYKAAVVAAFNNRYKGIFAIDAAKAFLVSVRQDSFQPWMATVVLGEDITDAQGKFVNTRQRSTKIARQDFNKGLIVVHRELGETAYQTWQKVEEAAGLDAGELTAILDLHAKAPSAVYKLAPLSLNWYGEVRVKFTYETTVTP